MVASGRPSTSCSGLRAVCLLLALSATSAFAPRHVTAGHKIRALPVMNKPLRASPLFEPIAGGVESYVNIWVPLFTGVKDVVPDVILKWGHGAAMATVLVAMGGIGAFLGFQIRAGNGEATYPVTLGKSAREQHPLIMSLMVFFFLLGGQGGLVLLAARGEPILESPHTTSALVGLGLLAVQALLPRLFERGGGAARTAHAALGTATLAALGVHLVNGVNLGLSL